MIELIKKINPKIKEVWQHELVYDSTAETLEPVYFWILDFVRDSLGFEVEKLVDNFAAPPGSGYFAELGIRKGKMQEEAMKILGLVNNIVKSIINLIYDLKEFEIRLKHYEMYHSKNPQEREAGLLALKQIWLDNVDIKRGRGSINSMTYELGFTTLRDAFFMVKNIKDVDKLDVNRVVKNVLKPRIAEFFEWLKRSEEELRKRFEIEKTYLKSQVNALKLYTRWARPYLKAAQELEMKETRSPDLVKAFSTVLLELTLFCKQKINVEKEVQARTLPPNFVGKIKRDYYACLFIDFSFRGLPTRTQTGHYVYGGKVKVSFKALALNEEEIKKFHEELDKEDLKYALSLVENVTSETLAQIASDIEHFLGEKEEKEKKEGKKEGKKSFFLFGKKEEIRKDNYYESVVRKLAELYAKQLCYKLYDIYKKAHAMPVFPSEPEFEA